MIDWSRIVVERVVVVGLLLLFLAMVVMAADELFGTGGRVERLNINEVRETEEAMADAEEIALADVDVQEVLKFADAYASLEWDTVRAISDLIDEEYVDEDGLDMHSEKNIKLIRNALGPLHPDIEAACVAYTKWKESR